MEENDEVTTRYLCGKQYLLCILLGTTQPHLTSNEGRWQTKYGILPSRQYSARHTRMPRWALGGIRKRRDVMAGFGHAIDSMMVVARPIVKSLHIWIVAIKS